MTEQTPIDTCSVEGCDRKRKARGLCDRHYQRQRRTGDVATVRRPGPEPKPARMYAWNLFKNDWSERTFSRYWSAHERLQTISEATGEDIIRQAIKSATRPNGTVNVAKFESIAGSQMMIHLDAVSRYYGLSD